MFSLFHLFSLFLYFPFVSSKVLRIDLGIAVHVWQDKRAGIAKTIDHDALGDRFRPAMRAGWL